MGKPSNIQTMDSRGVECIWGEIDKHPHCAHGPTLLFSKYNDGQLEEFYACSACRNRKLCNFYLKKEDNPIKLEKKIKRRGIEPCPKDKHHKLYIKFHELMTASPDERCYCHSCEILFFQSKKHKHHDHQVTSALTDYQMTHPTEFLKPLEDAQKEAQYLFSKKCTQEVVEMIVKLEKKQVLCIGTPRIHEWILDSYDNEVSSLLLDFDDRFHNFFGPLSFGQYNLFNNHFFTKEAEEIFKIFMTQNNGKDIILLCDPPFGGRVEAISQTLKTICDLHKQWNNLQHEGEALKIMFFFPYFMESILKMKSNPPNIPGGLRELQMTDYEVGYDNHPMFRGDQNKKSPVRLFTNIPLHLLELPSIDGYKYCKICQKWISNENKHCKKCNQCTSKNGKKYNHCNICQRCVKATWKHCINCKRCTLETHTCGSAPKINGCCYKCFQIGHTEKDCKDNSKRKKKAAVVCIKKRKSENGKIVLKKCKSQTT